MMTTRLLVMLPLALASGAFAQEAETRPPDRYQVGEMTLDAEDAVALFKAPGYSPYAGRHFPTRVYWGDTHLHTDLSLDARAFGVTVGPEEAYRPTTLCSLCRLSGGEPQRSDRNRDDHRDRPCGGTAWVEVGRQCDSTARIHEPAGVRIIATAAVAGSPNLR